MQRLYRRIMDLNIIRMNVYDVTMDMHLYFGKPFDCRDVALQRLYARIMVCYLNIFPFYLLP